MTLTATQPHPIYVAGNWVESPDRLEIARFLGQRGYADTYTRGEGPVEKWPHGLLGPR